MFFSSYCFPDIILGSQIPYDIYVGKPFFCNGAMHLVLHISNKAIVRNFSWPYLSLLHHWSKILRVCQRKLGSYIYKLGTRTSTILIPRSIIASCWSFNVRVPSPILRCFSNFDITIIICDRRTSCTSRCSFTRINSFKCRSSWSNNNWTDGSTKNNILTNQNLNYN